MQAGRVIAVETGDFKLNAKVGRAPSQALLRLGAFAFGLFLSKRRFIFVIHLGGCGGHTIFLISPAAKVYQLTAVGAERAVWIILPDDGFITVRTLHHG
jgi:hypothetical protein